MLVQAKRLDDSDCFYNKLDYRIGKKPTDGKPHVRQIDRLIQTAEKQGQLPIYIFYNHLNDRSRVPQNCGTLNCADGLLPESWGVSFASAIAVRNALPDKRFDRHRKHSLPFHCLLCSQGLGVSPGRSPQGSPGVVAAVLRRLFTDDELEEVLSRDLLSRLEPSQGIPIMTARAEEAASVDDLQEREHAAETLGEEYPDIAGAVILRDS